METNHLISQVINSVQFSTKKHLFDLFYPYFPPSSSLDGSLCFIFLHYPTSKKIRTLSRLLTYPFWLSWSLEKSCFFCASISRLFAGIFFSQSKTAFLHQHNFKDTRKLLKYMLKEDRWLHFHLVEPSFPERGTEIIPNDHFQKLR